jgi:hypothetical protein
LPDEIEQKHQRYELLVQSWRLLASSDQFVERLRRFLSETHRNAIGRPIGAAGTRVLITLWQEMQKRDAKKALH